MKKYNLYFAFLAIAAVFVILAACGSGEITNISDDPQLTSNINAVKGNLTGPGGFIKACAENKEIQNCEKLEVQGSSAREPELPSSSSDGVGGDDEESSSSSVPYIEPGTSSSNQVTTPSSSSNVVLTPSSSSLTIPPSSSSLADPNAYSVSSFTCAWEPASVVSGKSASIKIELANADKAEGITCTKEAWFPVINNVSENEMARYQFGVDTQIMVRFGDTIRHPESFVQDAIKFPNEPTTSSASFSGVKATVTCSGNGKPAGSRDVNCNNLTITKPPAASITPALAFTNAHTYSASSIFFIGETPTRNTPTLVAGASVEYCGEIKFEPESFGPLTAVGNVTVTAKCSLSGQTLGTAAAAVVADPTISGSCAWDTKNNTFGGGVSARVTAAPTIQNQYGRTCTGPYFSVSGVQKQNVSAGLTVDTWSGDAAQTMSAITIGATCADKATATIACPNITVKDPNAMCEYLSSWCGGITLTNIKAPATVSNPPVGQAGGDQCFFATTIGKLGNASSVKVNGESIGNEGKCGNTGWGQPTCAAALTTAGVTATDGGYYIYIPASGNWTAQDVELTNSYGPNLHPNCEAQK